jgi:hypothetical protein
VPTILEAAGIKAPDSVNGIPQKPIEGVSMMYTFDKANTDALTKHTTQYFEMMGLQAIYRDGWFAGTKPFKAPWDGTAQPPADIATGLTWELYDLKNDWTQSKNVASQYPDKLKELQNVFWQEAEKYQVLPLDGSAADRLIAPRPSVTAGRNEFTYTQPIIGIPAATAPSVYNRSFTVTADIEVPENGGEGMLMTLGGRFGGWGFYIVKGKPVFTHNIADLLRLRVESSKPLTAGKHIVVLDWKYDGGGWGKGATASIKIDGAEVASQKFQVSTPLAFEAGESFDVGSDTGTGVNDADYQTPFTFTGKLNKITISLGPTSPPAPPAQPSAAQPAGAKKGAPAKN